MYIGKNADYIFQNFPYGCTEVKHLANDYEVLIFERERNYLVGRARTRFYMHYDKCYKIETNEYTNKPYLKRVHILETL